MCLHNPRGYSNIKSGNWFDWLGCWTRQFRKKREIGEWETGNSEKLIIDYPYYYTLWATYIRNPERLRELYTSACLCEPWCKPETGPIQGHVGERTVGPVTADFFPQQEECPFSGHLCTASEKRNCICATSAVLRWFWTAHRRGRQSCLFARSH